MKSLLLTALLLLAIVPSFAKAEEKAEPTPYQKAYHLEHRFLPKLALQSKGRFYADLKAKNDRPLKDLFQDFLGARASHIKIDVSTEADIVLIEFPTPKQPVECYFVAIAKSGEGYRYFTVEMAEDITGEGIKACYGEWSSSGSHLNLGFIKKVSKADFIKHIKEMLAPQK